MVSNLPFIAIGAVGLLQFHHNAITLVLFTGIFLTGFGSSYYHLNPNDSTLFWDRLPMTLCFAAILSAVVEERVDARAGAMLLRPLWRSAFSVCCFGAGPTICGYMPGRSFFHLLSLF